MSDLKFGTSGLRGLVTELNDDICHRYTAAFLSFMGEVGALKRGGTVLVGYDLRASSPHIADAVMAAALTVGYNVLNCGPVPTPALALGALTEKTVAIMVTGSHIPEDRNGLKFYRPDGEITKQDELGILHHLPEHFVVAQGVKTPEISPQIMDAYRKRALSILPKNALTSMRIGVYQHSSVARDLLIDILKDLGAEVVTLARAAHFIPVDTEALSDEDRKIALEATKKHELDAVVSTDGDADRPMIADAQGIYLRGDIIGMLTARFLDADAVATPVTSTSLVESSNWFSAVFRCKVGSPYVIAAMDEARLEGYATIVGFEANGGVLLGADAALENGVLSALPTRDAILPILGVLGLAQMRNLPVAALCNELPPRFTASGRLQNISAQASSHFLADLTDGTERIRFFKPFGHIANWDMIDGLRVTFENGDMLHYRASGNAPELRVYSEAASKARADTLVENGLKRVKDVLL